MHIRPALPPDRDALAALRYALWPEEPTVASHAAELDEHFAGKGRQPYGIFVAEDGGVLVGFAEVGLRSVAEGAYEGPVGYLEGWYVAEGHRRRGIGRALVDAAEQWVRAHGCRHFGSDALLENDLSHTAHRALGFEETGRIVTFLKTV